MHGPRTSLPPGAPGQSWGQGACGRGRPTRWHVPQEGNCTQQSRARLGTRAHAGCDTGLCVCHTLEPTWQRPPRRHARRLPRGGHPVPRHVPACRSRGQHGARPPASHTWGRSSPFRFALGFWETVGEVKGKLVAVQTGVLVLTWMLPLKHKGCKQTAGQHCHNVLHLPGKAAWVTLSEGSSRRGPFPWMERDRGGSAPEGPPAE